MKTIDQIIDEVIAANYDDGTEHVLTSLLDNLVLDSDDVRSLMAAAIEADRAQENDATKGIAIFLGGFELYTGPGSYSTSNARLEELASEQRYATALSVNVQSDGTPIGLEVREPVIHNASPKESL